MAGLTGLSLMPYGISTLHARISEIAWNRADSTPYRLGAPHGVRSRPAADVVIAVDDSSSTASSGPARWAQTRELGRWLSKHPQGDRIGILAFTDGKPAVVQPLGDPADTESAIEHRPRTPGNGGTAFGPTAEEAASMLAGSRGAGRPAFVVWVTDGQGPDVPEAVRKMRGSDVRVFGLDRDGAWSSAAASWRPVQGVSVRGDGRSIAEAQTSLLQDLTGQRLTEPSRRRFHDGVQR